MRGRLRLGLVSLLAATGGLIPLTMPAAHAVTNATLHGTVSGVSGGLQNVAVEVSSTTTSGNVGQATTQANGSYTANVSPAGDYYVSFNPQAATPFGPGYATVWYDGSGVGTLDPSKAAQVSLADASNIELDITIPADGQISGRITDATSGQPLQRIDVQAIGVGTDTSFYASNFTAADGTYTITDLPPKPMHIWFEDDSLQHFEYQYYGGGLIASEGTPVTVVSNFDTGNINGALLAAAHVNGLITQAGGGAPSSVSASAIDDKGNVIGIGSSNGSYHYTIAVPATTNLRVEFAGSSGTAYVTQYFDNRPALSCADVFTVASLGTKVINPVMTTSMSQLTPCSSGGGGGGGGGGGNPGPTAAQVRTSLNKQLIPTGSKATIKAVLHKGGFARKFTALEAGKLSVEWKKSKTVVAKGSVSFSAAGKKTVTVKLTKAGKKDFKKAGGHLKLGAVGSFTPKGKSAIRTSKAFTLKKS